jgi:peptide/nickel transport system substrate-binding protein
MSLHEEATGAALRPMMGVFNNLIVYDQHVAQSSPDSIVPDLTTSWAWSEDGKELTFPLCQGVNWHDGKPFTAVDVKCTWDLLMDVGSEKLRVNPRKTWYRNVDRVITNGDYEVTFHLQRPQPALLSLLASGWSPVYPWVVRRELSRCHRVVDREAPDGYGKAILVSHGFGDGCPVCPGLGSSGTGHRH